MSNDTDEAAIEFIRQRQGAPEVAQLDGKLYVLDAYDHPHGRYTWSEGKRGLIYNPNPDFTWLVYRPAVPPTPLDGYELTGEAAPIDNTTPSDWDVFQDGDGLRWRLRRKPAAEKPAEPAISPCFGCKHSFGLTSCLIGENRAAASCAKREPAVAAPVAPAPAVLGHCGVCGKWEASCGCRKPAPAVKRIQQLPPTVSCSTAMMYDKINELVDAHNAALTGGGNAVPSNGVVGKDLV